MFGKAGKVKELRVSERIAPALQVDEANFLESWQQAAEKALLHMLSEPSVFVHGSGAIKTVGRAVGTNLYLEPFKPGKTRERPPPIHDGSSQLFAGIGVLGLQVRFKAPLISPVDRIVRQLIDEENQLGLEKGIHVFLQGIIHPYPTSPIL
jgi:hypothetical protein